MTAAPRTQTEFVDWLVARHPALVPILAEHLIDYDELLAHLLLADVTRHAAGLARRGEADPEADAELVRLLADLDSAIVREGQEHDPVDNLVRVSFVENASTDADEPLRTRLRSFPNLARALSHFE